MAGGNERILTCVYCGYEYPQATPTWGHSVLTEHIAKCEKHPMKAIAEENERLKAQLEQLQSKPSLGVVTGRVYLAPIKARCSAISKRPWIAQPQEYPGARVVVEGARHKDPITAATLVPIVSDGMSTYDAQFVAHAPEDIDALIREVEYMRARDKRWDAARMNVHLEVREELTPEEYEEQMTILRVRLHEAVDKIVNEEYNERVS